MPRTGKPGRRSKESYERVPGRPPDAVIDNRIAEAVAVLSTRPNIHRCQLHKTLQPRWKVHWRTVDRVVARAKKFIAERSSRSKEEWRCDVIAAYEQMLASQKEGIRLAALAGLRDLLGLDAPREVHAELSGPDAGPIKVESELADRRTTAIVLQEIRTALERKLKAGGNGNGGAEPKQIEAVVVVNENGQA